MTNIDELERAARAVGAWWGCINQYWPFEGADAQDGVYIVGHIADGSRYDVMCIDADTYGIGGESAKLAAFYAAATPAAVLELIKRLRAAEQDVARLDDAITKYKEQSCDSK